jgi:hypothetical protein
MNKCLTKSKFKLALECPTKLYYQGKKEYINKKLDNDFLQALAKGGFQVGELAKCYFPGGINISELDHETALDKTNELLSGDCIIYEAAFNYKNLFMRADIIIKQGNRIRLIEVKAKSIDSSDEKDTLFSDREKDIRTKWKPYLYDVAFQKYIIQKSYPEYKVKSTLLLVDKSKLATVDGLNQKFLIHTDSKGRVQVKVVGDVSVQAIGAPILTEVSVDDLVDSILNERRFRDNPIKSFEEWIHFYSEAHQRDEIIWDKIGSKCAKCEFVANAEEIKSYKSGYHECWAKLAEFTNEDFLKPSILKVHDFRKKDDYIAARKFFQENLTRADLEPITKKKATSSNKSNLGLSRIDRQEIQIQKSKNRDTSPYLDAEGLKSAMSSWIYPLHFIDFETTAVALPFNSGRRPYEQIVFQYSHHIMLQDGTVEHKGQWLNDKVGVFPNFDFVRALKDELGNEGTIFRYAAHENSILNAVYRQLKVSNEADKEELCEWIKTISKSTQGSIDSWEGHRNMVDLRELVYNYYYHPLTEGSNSIKDLLPAILSSSKFLNTIYSKPIYGTTIKSLNFRDHIWLKRNDDQSLVNPYDMLPPIFEEISSSLMDSLIMEEDAELQDGGAAMIAYAQMQFALMTDEERVHIRKALLQYCELDTLAMVMIVQEWLNLIK